MSVEAERRSRPDEDRTAPQLGEGRERVEDAACGEAGKP
jgi:hypothetical protein